MSKVVQALSSIEVYVIAEGLTERAFIQRVLAPYMGERRVYLHPIIIGKPGQKGGDIRFERAIPDFGNALKQRAEILVTTFFDYYGIDSEWPGKQDVQRALVSGRTMTVEEKASAVEKATLKEIVAHFPSQRPHERFIPYVAMHEFEALLFSGEAVLADAVGVHRSQVEAITKPYATPEEINDSRETAPSKRILSLSPSYRKVTMGTTVSAGVGIPTMRSRCPHFDAWLTRLENQVVEEE